MRQPLNMGKRSAFGNDAESRPQVKRTKISNDVIFGSNPDEDVRSHDQLRRLLAFQQENSTQLRRNLQVFKRFLESIAYGEESAERTGRLEILSQFLNSQRSAADDKESDSLPDLIQSWRFAAQANNDGLLSAVPAVLALLLKTISTSIGLRDCGVGISETLLRPEQMKLLDRGLSASKTKEHLISPCLRLLTEVVSFDGGSSARGVYFNRDITFKRMEILLNMRSSLSIEEGGQRKPSVRENALRFLFANFRFQEPRAKAELLTRMKLSHAIFQDIVDDAPDVVVNILKSVRGTILSDDALPQMAKSKLLTEQTLIRITALQNYNHLDVATGRRLSVRETAHSFLMFACTTLGHGVLVPQTGWYPATSKQDSMEAEDALRLESTLLSAKYGEQVPIRNTVLARLLQLLRPFASSFDRSLMIAVFAAAPELVADYFFKKKSFSFEPKLSATWIGYSAFLFSVQQLPLPDFAITSSMSERLPPPSAVIIESILPQPLSQKVLTRSLNQSSELITFIASRLLVMALQKLDLVLKSFRSIDRGDEWKQATLSLTRLFCQRCPELKHVIAAFRSCPESKTMLREGLAHLLALYYTVTPSLALDEKFIVSNTLMDRLANCGGILHDSMNMQHLELAHLLDIARHTPDMDWFQKSATTLSPFTALLRRLVLDHCIGNVYWEALRSVCNQNSILQQETPTPALAALVSSLESTADFEASNVLYEFLDNCVNRLVRKPIKYCGDLEECAKRLDPDSAAGKERRVSLLLMVLVDQWPFFLRDNSNDEAKHVVCWVTRYVDLSFHIGEDPDILPTIKSSFLSQTMDQDHASPTITPPCEDLRDNVLKAWQDSENVGRGRNAEQHASRTAETQTAAPDLSSKYLALQPPEEGDEHPAISRWTKMDLTEAVDLGVVTQLMLCLCSKYGEIRKQALVQVKALQGKFRASGNSEWQQVYLLLGEVWETASPIVFDEPLPYFTGVIAARCMMVLGDPLHFMYTKVNKFLNKSPKWNPRKLPSYWIDKVLLHPPTEDESHYREVEWVLDALMEGLRTAQDMDSYRKCNVFERLFSCSTSPHLHHEKVTKIGQLLYRASFVQGSTTLITRCGALSWVDTQSALNAGDGILLNLLASQLYRTCDQQRVSEWSSGSIA